MNLPKAKTDNIVVQSLTDETLIYNLTTNQAFCLNDTSSKVFEFCDGETTFDVLKTKYHLTDEIIYLALDGLQQENLLADDYASPFAGLSRREVIKKVGLASMIALPVIAGLVAPTAASAASACAGVVCDDNNACTTNRCDPQLGCVYTAISCNDGDACTTDGCNTVTGCFNIRITCPGGAVCNPVTGCP